MGKTWRIRDELQLKTQKKLELDIMTGVMVHERLLVMMYESGILSSRPVTSVSVVEGLTRHGFQI